MARRKVNIFSLSFLDIMACGFGAVVLFFMIINHQVRVHSDTINRDHLAEVTELELDLLDGHENLAQVKNSLERTTEELVRTQGLSERIVRTLIETRQELSELEKETLAQTEHLNRLKADVQSVEEEARRLRADLDEEGLGEAKRTFIGEGDRQYLTGLKVGGERILIMLDASASMLDETIVNIIRRRNMEQEQKLASRKWQRALLSVDWLAAQFPGESKFQIYTFNTGVSAALKGTEGQWLEVGEGKKLNEAVGNLRSVIPENGTSLENAFAAIEKLVPLPDNVVLITDGLPTMGRSVPIRKTVSASDRLKHFERAVKQMPRGFPVNIIMLPMEGDPRAASAYWNLAQVTKGSFMSPARDWP